MSLIFSFSFCIISSSLYVILCFQLYIFNFSSTLTLVGFFFYSTYFLSLINLLFLKIPPDTFCVNNFFATIE